MEPRKSKRAKRQKISPMEYERETLHRLLFRESLLQMKTTEFGTMYRTCVYSRQRKDVVPDFEKLLEVINVKMKREQYFYNQMWIICLFADYNHFICNNVAIIWFVMNMCLYMYKHVLSNMCVFFSIYCIFIFSLAWCHIGANKIFRQIADLKILKNPGKQTFLNL